jgi:biopolymer transport protein ExbD
MKHPQGAYTIHEGDVTPMIDMVFQLMAFFLFTLNFTATDREERIQLPESELARPPESALPFPITLHVTKEGTVMVGGEELGISDLGGYLVREATALTIQGRPLTDATVIIRGHKDTLTGKVQEVIAECQKRKFERFVLRAQERVGR